MMNVEKIGVKAICMAGVVMCASLAGAADHWAASFSNDVVNVAAGAAETLGVVNLLDGATMEKTGEGELTVPLANIIQQKDFHLKVSAGRVRVTAGATPTLPEPSALLNRAALWLDADDAASVVTATGKDGKEYVARWLDRRETKSAEPFDYLFARAECYDKAGTRTNFPVRATMYGLNVVDLKGVGSGAEFCFVKTLDEAVATTAVQAYEVFALYCQTRNPYGYLFGGAFTGYDSPAFHPYYSVVNVTDGYPILKLDNGAQFDARWWYDGKEIDATKQACTSSSRLFGMHFAGASAKLFGMGINSFSTTSYPERNGMDGYAEVMIFTNRLTILEHAAVTRYLCANHGKAIAATKSYTFDMAPGTEIVFDGVDPSAVKVTGNAKVTRPASGDYTVAYPTDAVLPTLGTGKTTLKSDVAIPATAGKVITAAEGYVGTDVTEADAATAGDANVVKKGLQKATVRTIPAGTRRLNVEEGILALSASYTTTNCDVYAAITNANFENILTDNNLYIKDSKKHGWQGHYWRVNDTWEDSYCEIVRQRGQDGSGTWLDGNWYTYKGQNWQNMLGNCYAALRGASALSTTITVPEAGDYELSFDWSRAKMYARLRVLIGPDADHLRDVGYVIDIDDDKETRTDNLNGYLTWNRRSFRVNALAAGEMTLMFRSDIFGSWNYSTTILFDNVVMKKLPTNNAVCELTGGDFEGLTTNATFSSAKTASERLFGSSYTLDDWECVQPSGKWAIGPVTRGMLFNANCNFGYYSYLLERCDRPGHAQLVMGNTSGSARKRITLPAGTWKLMADFVPFHKTNDLGETLRASKGNATLAATVQVGENAAASIGSITTDGAQAKFDQVWGIAFTVPEGGAEVVITLQTTTPSAGVVVDNLRLKRATAVDAQELVTDGEFTDGANTWKTDVSMKQESGLLQNVRAKATCKISAVANEWQCCTPHYDGATNGNFALIGDCAAVYQDVTFPESGVYRLSYYTRSRNNWSNPGDVSLAYGRNRLLSYTAANGVTNAIDIALVDTTNWVHHTALFNVSTPGTFSFGFRGLNVPTVSCWAGGGADSGYGDKTAFFDGVSIVRVDTDEVCDPVSLPSDLKIRVSAGAKLQLGFDGAVSVKEVFLGGERVWGLVNAVRYPDYLIGPGTLRVPTPGLTIMIR